MNTTRAGRSGSPARSPRYSARVSSSTPRLINAVDTSGTWGEAKDQLFAEQLAPQAKDVEILMRYHAPHSWLDGEPAAVTRDVGSGWFTYVGVWLDEPGMKRAVEWMLKGSNLQPDVFPTPKGVDVYKRTGQDHDIFIVGNTSGEAQTITLPKAMQDVLSGETVHSIKLPVYGVVVLNTRH